MLGFKKPGLTKVRFEFCTRIGDETIKALAHAYSRQLKDLAVVRNYYEKVSKISDACFTYLQPCTNLLNLSIIYSRKFEDHLALNLSLRHLQTLNLSGCPIHVTLEPLASSCPHLEELNLSGDSWVKRQALLGIAKHPNLMVFHMGHFEHSDFKCSE